jgi:hypothetical protein
MGLPYVAASTNLSFVMNCVLVEFGFLFSVSVFKQARGVCHKYNNYDFNIYNILPLKNINIKYFACMSFSIVLIIISKLLNPKI